MVGKARKRRSKKIIELTKHNIPNTNKTNKRNKNKNKNQVILESNLSSLNTYF